MNKKILFILPEFGFGGTVFSTLNMISILKDKYDISVLAMSHQGPVKERYVGINVLPENFLLASFCDAFAQISSPKKKYFATCIRVLERGLSMIGIDFKGFIYKYVAKKYDGNYDYIACCQEGASTIFLSKFKHSKKIAWFRSEYSVYKTQLSKTRLDLETKAYHNVDNIICVSKTTRDDMAKYFPEIDQKIIAIHNIQNCDIIIDKAKEKIDDSFDKNDFNIVSVGRFAPQKQFHLIPSIALELKKKGFNFKWYIIGDGNQEGAYDKFEEAMKQHPVSDCVKAIGSRLNPYPYIALANILVTTSYYEACPRVVAESKILNTPVISSDYSSAREFIQEGVTGYVVSEDMLSEKIGELLSDDGKYNDLAEKCSNYSMDNNVIFHILTSLFS